MKMKRVIPAVVKILCLLLLLGSFAMLLQPWMKLAVDSSKLGRLSPLELLELIGESKNSVLTKIRFGAGVGNLEMDPNRLNELADKLLEGAYSPPDLAQICRRGAELCQALGDRETASTLSLTANVLWGVLGLAALMFLIALICLFANRSGGIIPYLLLGIAMTAAVLLFRAEANRYVSQEGVAALNSAGAGMVISLFGLDPNVVHMGIAAYLCPFLALLAFFFSLIRRRKPLPVEIWHEEHDEPSPYPARRNPAAAGASWICPNCGSVRAAAEAFCGLCGTGRPGPRRCPGCGIEVPEAAAFCPGCGTRVPLGALPVVNPGNEELP